MIDSIEFLNECKKLNYSLFTGTPCSYLKPFINKVIDSKDFEFIETTNEGDAVALASGAWLGGKKSIVMFQNSGLGNAVNPLTSLSYSMKIPFLGIVTLRGEPEGPKDEPQHELMGRITTKLLETMEIPWSYFPLNSDEVSSALEVANSHIDENRTPYFFVMKRDSVKAYELRENNEKTKIINYKQTISRSKVSEFAVTRTEALKVIVEHFNSNAAIIATTGKTGRELFEIKDSPNMLYMVGSMGCALPIGLGLKASGYSGYTCVIDGDGALLMRMGNLALAGQLNTKKLIHIVLDNCSHDSTGGQKSFSEKTDFTAIALNCGYRKVYEVGDLEEFNQAIIDSKNSEELSFIRFIIRIGSPKNLGRPGIRPDQVALRLKEHLLGSFNANY